MKFINSFYFVVPLIFLVFPASYAQLPKADLDVISTVEKHLDTYLNRKDSPSNHKQAFQKWKETKKKLLEQLNETPEKFYEIMDAQIQSLGLSHLEFNFLSLGFLGMAFDFQSDGTVRVKEVYPDGAAAKNEIQPGDEILTIAQQKVTPEIVNQIVAGYFYSVVVKSAQGRKTLNLFAAESQGHPASGDDSANKGSVLTHVNLGKGKVPVLKIEDFSESYDPDRIHEAFAEARKVGRIIVDLRDVPGGRSDHSLAYLLKPGSVIKIDLGTHLLGTWERPGRAIMEVLGLKNVTSWKQTMPSRFTRQQKRQFLLFRWEVGSFHRVSEALSVMSQEIELSLDHSDHQKKEAKKFIEQVRKEFDSLLNKMHDPLSVDSMKLEDDEETDQIFLSYFNQFQSWLSRLDQGLDQILENSYPPEKRLETVNFGLLKQEEIWPWKRKVTQDPEPFHGDVCFLVNCETYCSAQVMVQAVQEYQELRTKEKIGSITYGGELYPRQVFVIGETGLGTEGIHCSIILDRYELCVPQYEILSPIFEKQLESFKTQGTPVRDPHPADHHQDTALQQAIDWLNLQP